MLPPAIDDVPPRIGEPVRHEHAQLFRPRFVTEDSGFLEAHGRAALILLGGAIGFVAPWAISHRDSYIYHFLPSYVLLVALLAGFVAREARTTLVIAFLALVLVVLAFYAPIWSMFETNSRAVNLRLFLPVWR